MALRQAGLMFRAEAAATLVVTPRIGEAFIVRSVFITNPSAGTQHATFLNDTARVGFFRTNGFGGRHLIAPNETARGENLLEIAKQLQFMTGYPVVQGESFTVNLDTGTADIFVIADSVDANDVKSTDQNGSKASDLVFMNYGTNLSNITATGYNKLDNRRNPAEMVAFPFGAPGFGLVPAARKAFIYMLGGQSMGRFVSGGNTASTQYIRLRTGSAPAQTIFDRNDVGYPFIGTTPGGGTDYTSVRQVLPSSEANTAQRGLRPQDDIVPTLQFNGNDEFSIQVQTTVVGAGQLNAGDIDVWVLMRIAPA